ncbi:hypothetical protein M2212_006382 [Bradyrhizobium elkanii]|nr:hypothetical protein [Bradyrhizobium elkanii]MCS3479536.1 hypothetical protein [Bradyrhizobium elkanii]
MTNDKPLTADSGITVADVEHAPFIYFEEAPALSYVNGLIKITLSAERTLLISGKVVSEQVAVGYLRTNIQGARSLIHALESAILLSQPVEQPEGKPS